MKPLIGLLVSLAASVFGLTLGYGYSQTKLAEIVAVHNQRISALERQMEENSRNSTQRMQSVLDSWNRITEVQKDFISTIKFQNDIISRELRARNINPP